MNETENNIATRRVLVEKSGYFIFDWFPSTEKSFKIRNVKELTKIFTAMRKRNYDDVHEAVIDILGVVFNKNFSLTPVIYNPDTFTPVRAIITQNDNGTPYRLRTTLSVELVRDLLAYNHGLDNSLVFNELMSLLVESIQQEL